MEDNEYFDLEQNSNADDVEDEDNGNKSNVLPDINLVFQTTDMNKDVQNENTKLFHEDMPSQSSDCQLKLMKLKRRILFSIWTVLGGLNHHVWQLR